MLDEYSYRIYELEDLYGFPGFGYRIEIADLVDSSISWAYEPEELGMDHTALSTPIAIKYRSGVVHEGLLTIRIWRK